MLYYYRVMLRTDAMRYEDSILYTTSLILSSTAPSCVVGGG